MIELSFYLVLPPFAGLGVALPDRVDAPVRTKYRAQIFGLHAIGPGRDGLQGVEPLDLPGPRIPRPATGSRWTTSTPGSSRTSTGS